MRRVLIIPVVMLSAVVPVFAKGGDEQGLADWAVEQTRTLPEVVNGVRMYRPEMAGGKLLTSDLLEFTNASDDQLFLKALMFVKEKLDPAIYQIEAVDFPNRRFTLLTVRQPGVDSQNLYSYTSAFQGTYDLLSFTCGEMKVDYKDIGILSKSVKFEKLNPASNPRHEKWIEEQSFLFSSLLKDLQSYIPLREAVHVTMPEYIVRGEVVAGMTPDDVVLTLGVPFSRRKSGDRDKWLYDSGTSVIFTDGYVTNVMY